MGIFSRFRENVVEQSEYRENRNDPNRNGKELSPATDAASTPGEKGLIQSVGEMLQHSAHNVKEAVFGHMESVSDGDFGSLPVALAMEEPFGQSDHVLAAVVEHDVRSSGISDEHEESDYAQKKEIVRTVRENLAQSAHIVKDAVFGHTVEANRNFVTQPSTPIEDDHNGNNPIPGGTADQRRNIIEAMEDIMSHSVQSVKDVIGNRKDVVEASPIDSSIIVQDKEMSKVDDDGDRKKTVMESVSEMISHSVETVKEAVLNHNAIDHEVMPDVRTAISEQESASVTDHDEDHEEADNKGLMQSVKEAAQEVKEEVMEAVHEVKVAVLNNEALHNVPESMTEDSGERPSMELVHTIVHD